MNFTGPFIATNISSMIELSTILDPMKELSLKDKYMLAGAPVSTRSPLIKRAFLYYVNAIIKKEVVTYKSSMSTQKIAKTQLDLLKAEDEVKKISLYLWLAYKMPELFVDSKEAELARIRVNHYCEKSLKSNSLLKAPQRKRRDDKDKKHHNRYKRSNEKKQDDDNDKKKTRRRRRR